jgi:hypothetical protein
MIGAVLIAIRYGAGEESIRHTLVTKENMHIPKAPAQGLLLENPVFSGMSEKLQKFGNEALNWDPFTEKMEKFKDDFIYKSIFQETTAENVYDPHPRLMLMSDFTNLSISWIHSSMKRRKACQCFDLIFRETNPLRPLRIMTKTNRV